MTRLRLLGAVIVGLMMLVGADDAEARHRRCRSSIGFGGVYDPYGYGGYGRHGGGYGYGGIGLGGGYYQRPIGYSYPVVARPIYGGGGYYGGLGYGGYGGYDDHRRHRRRNRTRNVLLGIGAAAILGAILSN